MAPPSKVVKTPAASTAKKTKAEETLANEEVRLLWLCLKGVLEKTGESIDYDPIAEHMDLKKTAIVQRFSRLKRILEAAQPIARNRRQQTSTTAQATNEATDETEDEANEATDEANDEATNNATDEPQDGPTNKASPGEDRPEQSLDVETQPSEDA